MNTKKLYLETLKKYYGYNSFKEDQYEVIEKIMSGQDVLGIFKTGFGKSICYQLPAIHNNKIVVVASPLISLMKDQVNQLNNKGIPACFLGSAQLNKSKTLREIYDCKYNLIYMSPEYLINVGEDMITKLSDKILMLAIDEAHCVFDYGVDFRKEYRLIKRFKKWAPNIPFLALTATATKFIQNDICKNLRLKNPFVMQGDLRRSNIFISVKKKNKFTLDEISKYLRTDAKDECSIIYCKTRKNTDSVAEFLLSEGIKTLGYHAGMTTIKRTSVQNDFFEEKVNVIVATCAFGMGINKENIRNVIHYGAPNDINNYYQEIGRAGRDGKDSKCILYYSLVDFNISRYLIKKSNDQKLKNYKYEMLDKVEKYIHTTQCRHKHLLNYLNDNECKIKKCKNICDNCLVGKWVLDERLKARKYILLLVKLLDIKMSKNEIILILTGETNKSAYKLLPYYNKISSKIDISKIIDKLLEEKLLKKRDLKLSAKGLKYLQKS